MTLNSILSVFSFLAFFSPTSLSYWLLFLHVQIKTPEPFTSALCIVQAFTSIYVFLQRPNKEALNYQYAEIYHHYL